MDTIKEIREQVEKYTNATDVDFDKMAGQGGVKFYEFKVDENGDMKTITHIALPIQTSPLINSDDMLLSE